MDFLPYFGGSDDEARRRAAVDEWVLTQDVHARRQQLHAIMDTSLYATTNAYCPILPINTVPLSTTQNDAARFAMFQMHAYANAHALEILANSDRQMQSQPSYSSMTKVQTEISSVSQNSQQFSANHPASYHHLSQASLRNNPTSISGGHNGMLGRQNTRSDETMMLASAGEPQIDPYSAYARANASCQPHIDSHNAVSGLASLPEQKVRGRATANAPDSPSPNRARKSAKRPYAKRTDSSGDAKWKFWHDLLVAFKQKYGHTRVPRAYEVDGETLGRWVGRQRDFFFKQKQSGLPEASSQKRIDMLNEIGFEWRVRQSGGNSDGQYGGWKSWFDLLVAFKQKHSHTRVSFGHEVDGRKLGNWVASQRKFFSRKQRGLPLASITQERIDLLNEIDFEWHLNQSVASDAQRDSWKSDFDLLVAFKQEHGHTRVAYAYEVDGRKLGRWVAIQRQLAIVIRKQQGLTSSITQERIDMLNEIGFSSSS
jgi:predicted nucleotidyltransferase